MSELLFKHSNIYDLAESVEYSKGAIVSKVIKKNENVNLTLFAFDEGQGLSEHSAYFDAIIQVIEGNGEIIINKVPYLVNTGQFIIMPANIPHAVNAKNRFKMLLTMIKG